MKPIHWRQIAEITLAVVFSVFLNKTCFSQVVDMGDEIALQDSRTQHLFTDHWSSLLDISRDESFALIFDGSANVALVNLKTCVVEQRLPFRREGSASAGHPLGQIAEDGEYAWTIFPDWSPTFSDRKKKEFKFNTDAMEYTPEQRQLLGNANSDIVGRKHGSFLVKWDLRTGESVALLKSPGRSILAFDQKAFQSKYIATIEGIEDIDAFKYWLCVYRVSDKSKLKEIALPDSALNRDDEFSSQVLFDEKNSRISVSVAKRFMQFRIGGGLSEISDTVFTRDYDEPILKTILSESGVIVARRLMPSTEDGVRFNDDQNHFDIVLKSGANQTQTPLATFTLPELPSDSYTRFFRKNLNNRIALSWRDDDLSGTTLICDPSTRSIQTIASEYQLEAVLASGDLISTVGIHDARGRLMRSFRERPKNDFETGDTPKREILRKRIFLAGSQTSIVEIEESGLVFTDRTTGETRNTIAFESLDLGLKEVDGPFQIDNAQCVLDRTTNNFIFALPVRYGLNPSDQQSLAGLTTRVDGDNRNFLNTIASTLGEAFLGSEWIILTASANGENHKVVRRLSQSPFVALASNNKSVAILQLAKLHAGVTFTSDFLGRDEHSLELVSYRASSNTISQAILGICELSQGYDDAVEKAGVDHLDRIKELALRSFRPRHNIVFQGFENGFVYANALTTQNDPGSVSLISLSSEGLRIGSRNVSLLPPAMRAFLAMAKDAGLSDTAPAASGLLSIAGPVCLGYSRSENSVFAVATNFNQETQSYGPDGDTRPLDRLPSMFTFIGIRFGDGKVVRKSSGDWLLDQVNPELASFEIPDSISFDSSGQYMSVGFRGTNSRTKIVHIPTMCHTLSIKGSPRFSFFEDSVVSDGRISTCADVQELGWPAFSKPIVPKSASRNLDRSNSASCYMLGVSGKSFADKIFTPLQFADFDVSAISELTQKQCEKEGMRYVPRLLSGTVCTREQVGAAIHEYGTIVQSDDIVVIAISSHGVRQNRGLYIVTPNSDSRSMQATAIGWPELVASISKIKAKSIYVYLDVCHAGSFSEAAIAVLEEAKEQLSDIPGLVVIASSQAGEVSIELDEFSHGAFTQALLESLKQHGAIDFAPSLVAKDVVLRVQELTNGVQTPQLIVSNPPRVQTTSARDGAVMPQPSSSTLLQKDRGNQ